MKGKIISSIEKILPHTEPMVEEKNASMLRNERYNFQLAFFNEGKRNPTMYNRIEVRGELAPYITVRDVGLVPVTCLPNSMDDYYLSQEVGVFPDVLRPFGGAGLVLSRGIWQSVWITVFAKDGIPAGSYKTEFLLLNEADEVELTLTHELEVLNLELPEMELRITNWMHYDSIARQHGVQLFDEDFYQVFSEYLKVYLEGGNNMLMVPLFTPPLDTKEGTERLTAQLVSVAKQGGRYEFNLSKVEKFIRFAQEHGVKYFEFSPLFTQWGGYACPKIMATENGEEKKIFGWETPSSSPEYATFLRQFLLALGEMIKSLGIASVSYLHLTDEPNLKTIDAYENCRKMVQEYVGGVPVMDALSDPEFKERGLVDVPACGILSYEKFKDEGGKKLFVYNCCTACFGYYSNRFITMPAQRTRVLGLQLYKSNVLGYLHWGFNFYNSAFSVETVNPYASTDSRSTFPAGDAFIVYPTENGCAPSLRYEVVKEGYQDYRALKLLESFIGRENVVALLEENGVEGYNVYPRSAEWHINFRKEINGLLKKYTR